MGLSDTVLFLFAPDGSGNIVGKMKGQRISAEKYIVTLTELSSGCGFRQPDEIKSF